MSVRSLILAILAALWLWPFTAHGQSPELRDAYSRFKDLQAQGRYEQALPFAEQTLRLGEREFGPDHPATATLLSVLAKFHQAQGKYGDAEPLYKRALAILERPLGPEHPDAAKILNNMALLYVAQGKYAEAEPLYKRSLAIMERAIDSGHPGVAKTLTNYAALLRKTGRGAEAAKMEARAKATPAEPAKETPARTRAAGPPIQAAALTNYGVHFASYGSFDLAQQGWSEIWNKHWQMLTGIQPYIYYGSLRDGQPRHHLYGRGLTKEQAEGLCRNLRQRNEYCAVVTF